MLNAFHLQNQVASSLALWGPGGASASEYTYYTYTSVGFARS